MERPYNRGDQRGWTLAGSDQFPVFDVTVRRRGRAWRWSVSTSDGGIVMRGSEGRRSAAAYQANRAIFLLLSAAPYQLNGFVRHSADGPWPKNCGVDPRPNQASATGGE
jgi:hypothetical protein